MNKVAYIIDTLEVGGAETSILEIASRLKNWKPFVISIYKGNTLKNRFEKNNIKVYDLGIEEKFGIRKAYSAIGAILEKEKPDLIHATLFKAEQFSRFLGNKKHIPVINSFVNDSYSKERYSMLTWKQNLSLNLYRRFDKYTAGKVTQFMSITNSIIPSNATALNINANAVKVIYRGRNIEEFQERTEPAVLESLKLRFGKGPIILTVSRLLLRKGYCEAIMAIKELKDEFPNLKYLIAGEGHDRKIFEDLIRKYDLAENVFLLGNRKDIPSLLKFCDIFLFPSYFEGQGGALVEAMIMGKPIVASKIPVLQESVTEGKSALLFKLKSKEDLTQKLSWALRNPSEMKKYGSEARNIAKNRFDIEKIAVEHEKLYEQTLQAFRKK